MPFNKTCSWCGVAFVASESKTQSCSRSCAAKLRESKISHLKLTEACKRGHEWTPANTYFSKRGDRHCRACHSLREAERRSRTPDYRSLGSPDTALARFEAKVDKTGPCWLWTGTLNSDGYGVFLLNGDRSAHRASYELHVGPIPDGLTIDHLCRVRNCVNPEHLEPVTQAENTRRGMAPTIVAWRTNRCVRGHDLSPDNVYLTSSGSRRCRTCRRERDRRRRHAVRLGGRWEA